jgi:voltage-gated potassium channel
MKENSMVTQFYFLIAKLRRKLTRQILPFLLVITLVVILFGSLVTFLFERGSNPKIKNYWQSLWLSFITMTTVGYGDTFPITIGGQIVGIISMVFGIGFLGLFTATIATVLVERMMKEGRGVKPIKCKGHIVICGWNTRGIHALDELKHEVDINQTPIVLLANLELKPVDDDGVFFVRGNQCNEKDLLRANIDDAKVAILLAGERIDSDIDDIDAKTVLAAMTIRSINPKIQIAAEILDPVNVSHLDRINVSEVLVPSWVMGNVLARSALHHGMVEIISDLVSTDFGNQIYKIPVNEELVGMEYSEAVAKLQRTSGYTLIALESDKEIITNATSHKLANDNMLFVIAASKPQEAV